LRCGIDPGAAPTVCFAAPPLAVFGCAKRSLRSHARINPSTQPSDVAGGSKSKSRAAAELTLILLSGAAAPRFHVGAAAGCDLLIVRAGLPAMAAYEPTNLYQMYSIPVGASLLANAA
ncbi:hypothetical protein, partial [Pseudomonas sp. PB106]|uniref:hypothetical protein n=1 Tax=Pseudomonas sp. PB106 TaxID=2494699 RepID=UPI001C4988A2